MLRYLLSFSLILYLINPVSGQTLVTTQSGQQLFIDDTGNWSIVHSQNNVNADLLAGSTGNDLSYNSSSSALDMTEEESLIYEDLLEQLKYYEADYFVKYQSVKSTPSGILFRNPVQEKLKDILSDKYEKSNELLNRLYLAKNSNLSDRQEILFSVKSEMYRSLKLSTKEIEKDLASMNIIVLPPDFEVNTLYPDEILFDQDCQLIFNGFDNRINKKRKEVKSDKWFGYTHPKLYNYFKEKDFLSGVAALMQIDGKTFLNLRLILASRDAKRSYGFVDSDAMLRITLVNGDHIYLENQIRSEGILEAYTGNTVYQCLYPLEKDDLKELNKTEIDRVGIMWTTGFEEYDIYNVDFIMNQLTCLNGKK